MVSWFIHVLQLIFLVDRFGMSSYGENFQLGSFIFLFNDTSGVIFCLHHFTPLPLLNCLVQLYSLMLQFGSLVD